MRLPAARLLFLLVLPGLVALGPLSPLAGQSVQGRITEAETDVAVFGADVAMLAADGSIFARTTSDVTGGFLLRLPDGPTFRLRVRHIGYREFTSDPLDRPGSDIEVRVRLGVNAIALDPITVVASRGAQEAHLAAFEDRRTNPGQVGGFFVTLDDIERRPAAMPTHHIIGLPGVRVQQVITAERGVGMDRSLIYLRHGTGGECLANVYVDGVRSRQSVDHTLDDLLQSENLGGIEVYPRPLSAPLQYQSDPSCGVVLFWTRRPEGAGTWSKPRIILGGGLIIGLVVGSLMAIG